jgi:membrane associated rhomboid family serine protease
MYPGPKPIYLTLLTAMFMHASWMHIIGNMLYLWIFGDNIEDRLGHGKFIFFYLVCGLAATAAHVVFSANSVIPSLGASGAIAGVLGAYLILFPKKNVRVLFARQIVNMPAFIVLGLWIALQIFSQIGVSGGQSSGVAYLAHIGGFIAGVVLIFLFGGRRLAAPRGV